MLDAVTLFGMGFSWGGFESLMIPFDCDSYRTATKWSPGGPTLRLHIGLENVDDLKADLERGFAALEGCVETGTPRFIHLLTTIGPPRALKRARARLRCIRSRPWRSTGADIRQFCGIRHRAE